MATSAATRAFSVRYGNWPLETAKVPANLLEGADAITTVRLAMGHAFMKQLNGDWKEHGDCKVVLDKSNPGVYVGRRQHPESDQKDDPFYIMEV